jgi:hypothetical protein
VFKLPVVVSITPNLVLVLLVYKFNELVVDSIEVNLPFCVVFVVLFELVYVLKSVLILPLAVSNELSLPFALEVKVFKLPVEVSITPNLVLVLLV